MEPLDFHFWKLFSVDSVFFSKGEVYSYFSFVEVDIREGSGRRNRWIESKSELSYHHFSFILYYPVIELLKCWRKIRRGEHSAISNLESKRRNYRKWEIFIWKGINQTRSADLIEIDWLSKNFSDRKRSSFVLNLGVVSRISTNRLEWSKGEYISIYRFYPSRSMIRRV